MNFNAANAATCIVILLLILPELGVNAAGPASQDCKREGNDISEGGGARLSDGDEMDVAHLLQIGVQPASEQRKAPERVPVFSQVVGRITTDASWYAGVIMTIIGQTACVIGMQMQKLSHMLQARDKLYNDELKSGMPGDESDYYFLRWRWIIGAFVWALGHLVCFVALGLAPQSILSCLQSWNIVVALALAPVILHERLPARAVEYASMLVVGCVVVVYFGPKTASYKTVTAASLEQAFTEPASIMVHAICLGLLVISMATSCFNGAYLRVEKYVWMSATCAWYSALCSKSMSMMLISSVATHHSRAANVGFWAFVVSFVIFGLLQIHTMNVALKYALASAVMPMYEAISMVGQLFFGGILFGEFNNFRGHDPYIFAPGVILVLVGLALLVRANGSSTYDDSKDEAFS